MAKHCKVMWLVTVGLILLTACSTQVTAVPVSPLPTPAVVSSPFPPPIAARVETLGIARQDIFVDGLGLAWETENAEDEFLVVYLKLPPTILREATNEWFEDGGTHGPKVFAGDGRKFDWVMVWWVGRKVMVLVFVIGQEARELVLWLPGKVSVDLTTVPDVSSVESVEEERPVVPSNPRGYLRE